jgi:hypothetical protein
MAKWICAFAVLLVTTGMIFTRYPAFAGTAIGENLVYRERRCKFSKHNSLFILIYRVFLSSLCRKCLWGGGFTVKTL